MQKLLRSKKGFTLIELIVVIVIIAILIAALTPAILGVIRRANRAADEADARTVMMAGSVAGLGLTPPGLPTDVQVLAELTGSQNVRPGTYLVHFEGAVGIGCNFTTGTRTGDPAVIGSLTAVAPNIVTVLVPVPTP